MDKNLKFLIYFAILFVIGFIFLAIGLNKKNNRDFQLFYSHTIAGRVTGKSASTGGERFRINDSSQVYRFQSIMSALNHYKTFTEVAYRGDSVYKKAFSDTLYLFKKDSTVYKFTFEPK
ncbi:MAG TPA: hypothetical protein VHW43_10970 [Puia sp.]|jgi:hypothetical protein|nr:hypothetical protein [Puia sp.]